jgi:tetratricopeptide (TPR) repeat protein
MLDFFLTISEEDKSCRVTLRQREVVLAAATAPLDFARLRQHAQTLNRYPVQPFSHAQMVTLGTELSDLLLPPPVRQSLYAELMLCPDPAAPVRLRLSATSPQLAELPWEFVYLADADVQDFLSLHPRGFHIIRQAQPPVNVPPVIANPLRVLIAWADPRSPKYAALAGLEDEVKYICAALRAAPIRGIVTEVMPQVTPLQLKQRLESQPQPHVLHFLGHGDVRGSSGVLVLSGAQPGQEALLNGNALADWLEEAGVPLVVLSACLTGMPAHGVAETLSRKGVPAVVGMQLPLRDATAGQFAHAFYSALLTPLPVEKAVSAGRQAVQGAGPDWGVPVLYLSSESGELFEQRARPPIRLPYLPNQNFVGRDADLKQIRAHRNSPVALVGLGGLGKTQLAVEYAYERMMDYPGGVFCLNATNSQRLEHDYAELGAFFDVPSDLSTHDRATRVLDRLQGLDKPSLLILDNVTEDTNLVLPPGGLCHILITTRYKYLAPDGCHVMNLLPLNDAAAMSLLQVHRRVESEEEQAAARDIAEMLGRLPLALALVAHYVKRRHITFVLCRERLAAAPNRLRLLEDARRAFTSHTHHDASIFNIIALTQGELSRDARHVLATAAHFAGRGISPELLFAACDITEIERFEDALAELVEDFSLITRDADERLSLHELVRVFARGSLSDDERAALIERVAAVLTDCLKQANESMDWTRARPEIHHCRAVSEFVRKDASPQTQHALWFEMGRYDIEHGDYAPARVCFEDALAASQAAYGSDRLIVAQCLRNLSWAEQGLGEREKALAHQRQALALAESALSPDDAILAEFYNYMGYILKMQGNRDDALPYYRKALQMNAAAHGCHHPEVATCLTNIGMLLLAQGNADAALTHLRDALHIYQTAYGDRHKTVAILLNNIGQALVQKSAPQEAWAHHQQALEIYKDIYGQRNLFVAYTYRFIADALRAMGEKDGAFKHHLEALVILEHLFGAEHPRCEELRALMRSVEEDEQRET